MLLSTKKQRCVYIFWLQHKYQQQVRIIRIEQCRLATLPIQDQQQQSKPLQPVFKREPGTDGQVVGTVEISLVPSTRTRYLTLNAPEVLHMLGVLIDHSKSLTAL